MSISLTQVFKLAIMGKLKKHRLSSVSQFFTLRSGFFQSTRSVENLCVSTFTWLLSPHTAYHMQQEAGRYVSPPLHPRHARSLISFSFSSSADGGSEEVVDLRSASLDPHHGFAGQGRAVA